MQARREEWGRGGKGRGWRCRGDLSSHIFCALCTLTHRHTTPQPRAHHRTRVGERDKRVSVI